MKKLKLITIAAALTITAATAGATPTNGGMTTQNAYCTTYATFISSQTSVDPFTIWCQCMGIDIGFFMNAY